MLTATTDAAIAAEQAGFDDAWFAEHHFMSYGVCPSAMTLAAFVLGQTSRIAVGTAVSVLPVWHPVALAEQTALLDQVSAGQFRLGVGRGGPWVDLEVFGTGLRRYESGFAESLDLLLTALSQDTISAAGPLFTFPEISMVPRPRTRPLFLRLIALARLSTTAFVLHSVFPASRKPVGGGAADLCPVTGRARLSCRLPPGCPGSPPAVSLAQRPPAPSSLA